MIHHYRHAASRWIFWTLSLSTIGILVAQEPPQIDLSRMDVEDLMNIKVTSVSKREQSLARTAAAVFVINQEEIRRSGATNLPDLLRMAPGVDVEQIDANAWAISVRGFNSRYSNKVLVLIDGRTVYTPSFSGVFWEHLDMPLENIERIEVIRGPGATVWGANAVNGVISIFTKSAKDTKGGTGHSRRRLPGARARRGAVWRLRREGTEPIRVYGKYFDIGNSAMPDGSAAADHWMRVHGGFRADWDLSQPRLPDGAGRSVCQRGEPDAAERLHADAIRSHLQSKARRNGRKPVGALEPYPCRRIADLFPDVFRYLPPGRYGSAGSPTDV